MTLRSASLYLPALFLIVGLGLPADVANGAAVSIAEEAPVAAATTVNSDAQRMFADAPYGVDPVVTGPRSAPFRQQQQLAGCDKAVWPDIPIACYPG